MNNRYKVRFIIVLLLLIVGSLISLEWTRLFLLSSDIYHESFFIVKILKLMASFLCAFLVWTTFGDKYSISDSKKIKAVFLVIFIGDIAFNTGNPMIGVAIFSIAQILLINRNSNGFFTYLRSESSKKSEPFMIITAISLLIGNTLLLYFIFFKRLGLSPIFFGFTGYSMLLCVSLWIAWLTKKIRYFTPRNSLMISIGMTCFYLGDIVVGIGMIISDPPLRVIVTSLIWILYAPSIILLSLSSYKYDSEFFI
jgi:hypothetical protein